MNNKNLEMAKVFYNMMIEENFDKAESILAQNVVFKCPIGELSGKDNVIKGGKQAVQFFKNLSIKDGFSSENKVVLILDVEFLKLPSVRASALLTFDSENKISRIEEFFDASLFRDTFKSIFENVKNS